MKKIFIACGLLAILLLPLAPAQAQFGGGRSGGGGASESWETNNGGGIGVINSNTTNTNNSTRGTRDLKSFVDMLLEFANLLLTLLIALALLSFFKGLVSFMVRSGSKPEIEKGKNLMIWGLLSLFVMVSLYGILGWLKGNFGFTNPFHEILPLLPTNKKL